MKWKDFFQSTFAKYILSYAAILATVVTGLSFIVNYQLKQEYLELYLQESRNQISYTADQISKGLLEIDKTDLLLASDVDIINAKYSNADYSRYLIIRELGKYCSRDILCRDILYLDQRNHAAYSTTRQYDISGSSLRLSSYGGKQDIVIPQSYYDSDDTLGKIVPFSNGTGTLLLFSPRDASSNARTIYVLDQDELGSLINTCLSKGVSGAKLVDASGRALFADGAVFSAEAGEKARQSPGDVVSLQLDYPIGVRFQFLFDKDFIQASTNTVFVNTYLMVGLLIAVEIIITVFCMRITYSPLHKLKMHITNSKDRFSNDISLLNRTYQASNEFNMLLQKRLNNYRTVIHESILGSRTPSQKFPDAVLESIDRLFASDSRQMMAVVKLRFPSPPAEDAAGLVQSRFGDALTAILLEEGDDRLSLLLAWKDLENADDTALQQALGAILERFPCTIAFSNYTTNPLDIARLYSNATAAEKFLSPGRRIAGYDDIPETPESYEQNYAYQLFDQLAEALEKADSSSSFRLVRELLGSIDPAKDPEMFIRCILIDTTTLIGTCMSRNAVKYEKYSAVFTRTLDLCRKGGYPAAKREIQGNLNAMLEILFTEISDERMPYAQIEAFVQNHFSRSDFSITALADRFHVSIAYMSFLFKKKFDVNFSSYVWRLRYEKSQVLLSTTEYPIEKIGALVGYDNASSFRRKFKDESGISPSQYRKGAKGSPPVPARDAALPRAAEP